MDAASTTFFEMMDDNELVSLFAITESEFIFEMRTFCNSPLVSILTNPLLYETSYPFITVYALLSE